MKTENPNQDSNYSHKQIILQEATRQLNRDEIDGKIMTMNPDQLTMEQEEKINSLIPSERQKALKKIIYYDHSFDMKRKCEHFMNLFQKLKRKIVLQPFTEIDLHRFQEDYRTPPQIMFALLLTLVSRRARKAYDGIISFVERRNELAELWFYFMEEKLKRRQREMFREARAEAQKSREERERARETKNDLIKTQKASKILRNMIKQMSKAQVQDAFNEMKKGYMRQKEEEEEAQRREERERKRRLAEQETIRKESDQLGIAGGFNFMIEKSALQKEALRVESEGDEQDDSEPQALERQETAEDEEKFVLERSRKGPLNMYAEEGSDFEQQSLKSETLNSPDREEVEAPEIVDLTMGETADELANQTEENNFRNEDLDDDPEEESHQTEPKGIICFYFYLHSQNI